MSRENEMVSRVSKRGLVLGLWLCLCAGLTLSCASRAPYDPNADLSVSIPYDPYNYDPDALDREAQAHCDAYNLFARFVDETIDEQSVRWRYRHYNCV
ncbi:MAG: hypothetical protein AAGH42_07355 [Pseudomonadota bacterium]